jgi:hypothetical protein
MNSPVKKFKEVKISNEDSGMTLIRDILNHVSQFIDDTSMIIFRGVSKDYTPDSIRSGAAVRLDPYTKREYTYSDYMAYIRGLITNAKKNYPENYAHWNDLEILGDLQHNGAATCLVDFSRNVLISLWFACGGIKGRSSTDKDEKSEEAGVLYCYDVNEDLIKRNNLKIVKESDMTKPIEDFLVETKPVTNYCSNTEYSFFMWTPSNLNNRIARQDSVFIFGLPVFTIEKHSILKIVIPSQYKKPIRRALEFYFDVTDTSIFNDRHGFATINDKLSIFSLSDDKYRQGLDEMFKGNYSTALDFFIMHENKYLKITPTDPQELLDIAELHLSKAICYKNHNHSNEGDRNKYSNNSIREYAKARSYYLDALRAGKDNIPEWKENYAKKLLRTCNDEIHLLYLNKEYRRCINACDIAIENIIILHDEMKMVGYKSVYCQLSKLELILLIILEKEKLQESDIKEWESYYSEAQKETERSEFDDMLLEFFDMIWGGINKDLSCNESDSYTKNEGNKDFYKSVIDKMKALEERFNKEEKDSVPYSSWDFTEIKDAISNTKIISEDNKIALIELVACMISIRDRYNIRELNTHSGNT